MTKTHRWAKALLLLLGAGIVAASLDLAYQVGKLKAQADLMKRECVTMVEVH